ncbi:MAG: TetR/AcrR family transcriptional regulator [Pseudomonadota bacterium]
MAIKARALREEDKQQRRQEILDAAERLFCARPDGLASMDELAEAAGLAKGTLYLYFRSKEEVLVALHERHAIEFFRRLHALLDREQAPSIDELIALGRELFIEQPVRLSLASLVVGLTERQVAPEAALRFKMALGERLLAAGQALDARLGLAPGEGTRLLNASYALVIGMWQLKGCMGGERYRELLDPKLARAFVSEYPAETTAAIRTLWETAVAGAADRARRAGASA